MSRWSCSMRRSMEFFQHSGPMYMSDEENDEEDKTVVWVKPPQWRAPRLTDMVLRCQAVLDLNLRNNTTPSSNKERKRKELDFTDRLRPSGRAAEMYIWAPEDGNDNSMDEDRRVQEDNKQEEDSPSGHRPGQSGCAPFRGAGTLGGTTTDDSVEPQPSTSTTRDLF
uniref:Uncharacterized protein n=1 Tax=Branchiostoma floridae TaxID=7739 RepID=C3Y868_BRAFL|eukprot:XP_002607527.1 hypothetical protein BRAFLDRAFT_106475 [Branchiostoma floridae]